MHVSQTSFFLFAALTILTLVTAKPLFELDIENKNLVERQAGDGTGNSIGNSAGRGAPAS